MIGGLGQTVEVKIVIRVGEETGEAVVTALDDVQGCPGTTILGNLAMTQLLLCSCC